MDFQKLFARIKAFLYVSLGAIGLGVLLLIIGIIAKNVVLDIVGVLLAIGGGALFIYEYPDKAKYTKIKKARDVILSKKSVSEYELANALGIKERDARGLIDVCFRKGCVPGYIRKGQTIYHHEEYALEEEKTGKTVVAVDCPNCGANFKGVQGVPNECPYCRSFINM